jgi:cytochrome P450
MDTTTIDLVSTASFAAGHPVEQYHWLLEHDPVHRHAESGGPGFWAVTRYADVKAVGKDPERFSSKPLGAAGEAPPGVFNPLNNMLFRDPPHHTRTRLLVNKAFTPRAVSEWTDNVSDLATRIVDEISELGECDLVPDVAGKLPSYVIAELLGIPLEDGVQLYELTETMHASPETATMKERLAAAKQMMEYAAAVFEDKSRTPGPDIATTLINATLEGERLDVGEFSSFFLLLINAGGDTTRNVVAGAMEALLHSPDQMALLQSDPDGLMPTAVEEFVRWVSPVVFMRRTATVDCEIGGRLIAQGEQVAMYYGAANRDPRVFSDPDRFDVTRQKNEHVAFGGGGPHFCLGAHFARLEVGTMIRELVTRIPDMEPAGPTSWVASNFVSGPSHLPVRYRPRAVEARR